MKSPYLQRCSDLAGSVPVDGIEDIVFEQPSQTGNQSAFYPLAEVMVDDEQSMYLGLKVPRGFQTRRGRDDRLLEELPAAAYLADNVPEINGHLPGLLANLSIQGRPVAVLTEDASLGGQKNVASRPVSDATRELLRNGLCDDGENLTDYLYTDKLHGSMGFDVAGEERILDLTPNPIREEVQRIHTEL